MQIHKHKFRPVAAMHPYSLRIFSMLIAGTLWGSSLAVASPRLKTEPKLIRVIVKWKALPDARQSRFVELLGFSRYRNLPLINSEAGTIRADKLAALSSLSCVRHVSPDASIGKTDTFTVGSTYADKVWQNYHSAGTGVGIAVLDTGVSDVADLHSHTGLLGFLLAGQRLCGSVDFTGEGTADSCGHGTHVAGIIAGDGTNSQGLLDTKTFYGIAPGTNLYNVKVLNHAGSGLVSNAVAAVQWVLTNKQKYNIRVINMSIGHPVGESYETDPLCQAAEQAWKAGVVVVCAAGNDGRRYSQVTPGQNNSGYGTNYWSVQSPGNDPYVITVGATKSMDGNRADDQIASYSGRGPSRLDFVLKPDIIAPGNKVISNEDFGSSYLVKTYGSEIQILNSYYQVLGLGYSSNYFRLSGTSMATPVVSGAVALMLQVQPNLSPDTVKARLMLSADKWWDTTGFGDPCTFGAGYLNIMSAMANKTVLSRYALSPTLIEDGYGNVFAELDPNVYGQRFMWGTGYSSTDVYGARAMWGTCGNYLTSSRFMWGTSGWTDTSTTNQSSGGVDCSSSSMVITGDK